jgi:hypothetical protein
MKERVFCFSLCFSCKSFVYLHKRNHSLSGRKIGKESKAALSEAGAFIRLPTALLPFADGKAMDCRRLFDALPSAI